MSFIWIVVSLRNFDFSTSVHAVDDGHAKLTDIQTLCTLHSGSLESSLEHISLARSEPCPSDDLVKVSYLCHSISSRY